MRPICWSGKPARAKHIVLIDFVRIPVALIIDSRFIVKKHTLSQWLRGNLPGWFWTHLLQFEMLVPHLWIAFIHLLIYSLLSRAIPRHLLSFFRWLRASYVWNCRHEHNFCSFTWNYQPGRDLAGPCLSRTLDSLDLGINLSENHKVCSPWTLWRRSVYPKIKSNFASTNLRLETCSVSSTQRSIVLWLDMGFHPFIHVFMLPSQLAWFLLSLISWPRQQTHCSLSRLFCYLVCALIDIRHYIRWHLMQSLSCTPVDAVSTPEFHLLHCSYATLHNPFAWTNYWQPLQEYSNFYYKN